MRWITSPLVRHPLTLVDWSLHPTCQWPTSQWRNKNGKGKSNHTFISILLHHWEIVRTLQTCQSESLIGIVSCSKTWISQWDLIKAVSGQWRLDITYMIAPLCSWTWNFTNSRGFKKKSVLGKWTFLSLLLKHSKRKYISKGYSTNWMQSVISHTLQLLISDWWLSLHQPCMQTDMGTTTSLEPL